MKKLKLILFALCLLGFKAAVAQEIFATGGDYYKNANGSVSVTIGEPIGDTFVGTVNILTQGFQQTKLAVNAIYELPGLTYSISAFPNPTKDIVTLKAENSIGVTFWYFLYDSNAKLILQNHFNNGETEISFGPLEKSTYILKIYTNQQEVKSFKIVKK